MQIRLRREPSVMAESAGNKTLRSNDIVCGLSDEDIVRIGISFMELMGITLSGMSVREYARQRGWNVNVDENEMP